MTIYLKQSTASQEVPLGYFVDSTDGNTEETGLTIANTDIKLWKAGATTLANKNSGGATHISNGIYYAVLDATDTNTLGSLKIFVHVSGALPVVVECVVLAANVYDSLIGGGDLLTVDVTQIEGSDATDQINAACDTALADYDAPTKAELDAGFAALNDPTAAAIADAVLDEALSGHTTAGTLGKAIADIETDATAILADTNELQTDDVPGLIAALNDPTAAAIADAVWDEAKAGHVAAGSFGEEVQAHALSSEISALNDPTAGAIADAVWTEAIADHSGTGGSTAEALSNATAPTAAAVADAVWDEALSGHLSAGSTGEALNAAGGSGDPWVTSLPGSYTSGQAGNILGNIAATINTQADAALADYDPPTKAELDAGLAALNDPTAAAIADAVWDEAKAGHVAAGSFGEEVQAHALSAEISALNDLSAAEVNAEVDTAISDASLATAAALATVDTNVDAILVDTNELQTDLADGGRLDLLIDAILADTNELQTDDVPGLIAALNDLSAADVNAQVVDALATDTYAEPSGVPAATATLAAKLGYLYMALRNRVDVTSTKKTFYDDGDAAEWEKDLSDDGTTYSESEANAI